MFEKKINFENEKEMTKFLDNHFRYDLLNSWNGIETYANCIKVNRIGQPNGVDGNTWFGACTTNEWGKILTDICELFETNNDGFAIYTNGRSSGYLVLCNKNKNCGLDLPNEGYEWDNDDLKRMTAIVCAFDSACDSVVEEYKDFCVNYKVAEEEILIPKTVTVMRPREDSSD